MPYLTETDAPPFLRGGGIMGKAIRAFDWSGTPLGEPDQWPGELRTAVGLMLGSEMPVYVAYGPDLISLYNDGYLPIVGGKHPGGLGQPFRQLWAEIWDEYEKIVSATLAGQAQHFVDQPVALASRPGRPMGYFTFSWTALHDEDGRATGLYCTSNETTDRILAERSRASAVERLELALSVGNGVGSWDWDVVADRITADRRFASLYGVDPDVAAQGAPIAEFFKRIHPDDLPRLQVLIERTMTEGVPYAAEYRLLDGNGAVRWVAAQGAAIFDADGRCVRFPGVSFDITDRMNAQIDLRAAIDAREFIIDLSASQRAIDDPEAIMAATVGAVGARLGADRCFFVRQTGADTITYGPSWSAGVLPDMTGQHSTSRFSGLLRQAREDGVELVLPDITQSDDAGLRQMAANGVGSGVFIPLRQAGSPVGGLTVHTTAPRNWTVTEVNLLREVTQLTMLAVERAAAVIRLQQRLGVQQAAIDLQAEQAELADRQIAQLHKMEAMGQLTSGIAHDFNNMITVVTSGLNLVRRAAEDEDPEIGDYIDAAFDGAQRASALARRLMAFARQSSLAPEAVDAGALIASVTDLLGRTLGAGIRLQTEVGEGLWTSTVDRSELENVILNLAVNARDAMPEGGTLTLAVRNTFVDEVDAAINAIRPGQYVLIEVSDTGTGMSPEVAQRAFEPFFTTKEPGKGTGLGLAQVFRFTRQLGGHAAIASIPGEGTTISLWLPRWQPGG